MEEKTFQIKLINEERSSSKEVIASLIEQRSGTSWAEKSNQWAIDYVNKLTEVYGDCWYKGLLPKEFLSEILLPKHGWHEKENEIRKVLFPLDTPLSEAKEFFKEQSDSYSKECTDLIQGLKDKIKQRGFTSQIVLAVINDTLKHVDGLHRMIALTLLLDEGYTYEPIPVFLCDATRTEIN